MTTRLLSALLILSLAGCSSLNRSEKGSIIGASAGAVLGGIIGKKVADKPVAGVVVGAAVGGVVGGIIGARMDKKAEELEKELENARVERVGEGIIVTMDSAILFTFDSSELTSDSRMSLLKLASSLKDFEGTEILVAGHTDATGSDEYNQSLSERRASSAAVFLAENGIEAERLSISGYGESQPISSNDTVEGRSDNRRVEIAITATEEYRAQLEAEQGEG
jgi:outer membrane protein OmpA-like peptidoglycan-associated protein